MTCIVLRSTPVIVRSSTSTSGPRISVLNYLYWSTPVQVHAATVVYLPDLFTVQIFESPLTLLAVHGPRSLVVD